MSLVPQLPARAPASSSRAPRDYIPTLDGWRAIAIMAVIVCHGSGQLFSAAGRFPNPQWLRLTDYGALGVDVFFGISGFLICTRILQDKDGLGRISLRSFYIRRAFRILPPYLLHLAVLGLLTTAGILTVQRWEFTS